jgi:hypothetical protein
MSPLAGAIAAPDRVALAGGGFGVGLDPRRAFLALGDEGAELGIADLEGEPYDPAPLVVAEGGTVFVFRYVSEPTDLAASTLVARAFSADGASIDRLELRTDGGLAPIAVAAYEGESGAGLVWAEPDGGVRVLPATPVTAAASEWRACGGAMRTSPVALLPDGINPPLLGTGALMHAIAGPTGDVLVVVRGRTYPQHVTVMRIPACRIVRT